MEGEEKNLCDLLSKTKGLDREVIIRSLCLLVGKKNSNVFMSFPPLVKNFKSYLFNLNKIEEVEKLLLNCSKLQQENKWSIKERALLLAREGLKKKKEIDGKKKIVLLHESIKEFELIGLRSEATNVKHFLKLNLLQEEYSTKQKGALCIKAL